MVASRTKQMKDVCLLKGNLQESWACNGPAFVRLHVVFHSKTQLLNDFADFSFGTAQSHLTVVCRIYRVLGLCSFRIRAIVMGVCCPAASIQRGVGEP